MIKLTLVYLNLAAALFMMLPKLSYAEMTTTKIIIFASFSMPDSTLKQLLAEADKIKAPVVLRGLLHNSLKETAQKIASLIENHPYGFQIDPILFRQYDIKKVPAIVVTNHAQHEDMTYLESEFDVIYGSITLDYALTKISSVKSDRTEYALKMLAELRGKHD